MAGLTRRYGRRIERLRSTPAAVGLALADRAGARMARVFGVSVSRSTVLRLVEALPDPEVPVSRAVGVDEYATRKGRHHGTVLVDGTPQAVQVADRWHLWHNLSEAAERCVADHRGCLQVLAPDPAHPAPDPENSSGSPWPRGHRFADRTRVNHATVHELLAAGLSRGAIGRQLRG
ncbi:hypothetical protein ACFQ7O_31855 [Streptomyces sp. NPDC056485]|uniref:hypothetical protein n=1 Tax=Streptomyces sp. NPDC056485 TaxID=3345834 RepID=UPI00369D7301